MHRFGVPSAAFVAAILAAPGGVAAAGVNQFIGFGDSTMDSGYFSYGPTGGSPSLPVSYQFGNVIDLAIQATVAAGSSGAFAGLGVVDTIQLAAKFGLSARPVTMPGGGTNHANGSAQTVAATASDGYANGLYNTVPTVTEIYNYLASVHGAANPDALYMISFGGNDLAWLDNQGGSVSPQAYLASLATAMTEAVVVGACARRITPAAIRRS